MVKTVMKALVAFALLVAPAWAKDTDQISQQELDRYLNQNEREYLQNQGNLDPEEIHLLFHQLKQRQNQHLIDQPEGRSQNAGKPSQNPDGGSGSGQRQNENASGSNPAGTQDGQGQGGRRHPDGNADHSPGAAGVDNEDNHVPGTENDGQGRSSGRASGSSSNRKHQKGAANRGSARSDRYVPPSWSALRKAGKVQESKSSRSSGPFFGIRLGTKFRAEIKQVVTNVESNLAEIHVVHDVIGDYGVMASGTKIYARKALNSGTNRLEMVTSHGITPQGREFRIKAIVLDINKSAGLSGAVTTDGNMAKRSAGQGAFEVGRTLVSKLNDGSIVGAGVEAAAENALEEKQDEVDKELRRPLYTITVQPQEFFIRVEQTF